MFERLVGDSAHGPSRDLASGRGVNLAKPRTSAIRRVAVAVIGSAVLVFGVALIVLPGPAVVVIPLGLAILAKEFSWARTLLDRVKKAVRTIGDQAQLAFRKIQHALGIRSSRNTQTTGSGHEHSGRQWWGALASKRTSRG